MTITSTCYLPIRQTLGPPDVGKLEHESSKSAPPISLAVDPPFKDGLPLPANSQESTSADDVIVIDNGSSLIRAGFSNQSSPEISFPGEMSRFRDRKLNRTVAYAGWNVYADAATRHNIRKVFEPSTSVVVGWDVFEVCLDQIFTTLGCRNEDGDGVGRGILMTEVTAGLAYTRKTMNELLFECYKAPSVAYGIDSLFSYRHNNGRNGLVVSSGNAATHIIPVIDGKAVMSQVSRLNWGGWHGEEFMMRLLRLKYSTFPDQVKDFQVRQMIRDHCYVSQDFNSDMSTYLDWTGLEDRDRIIQYPYVEQVAVEKSQEELDRIAEKKRLGGVRLQEQAAKMRLEKLVQKEQNLEYYKDLQARLEGQSKKEVKRLLDEDEIRDEKQLARMIKDLEKRIRQARNKNLGIEEPEEDENAEQSFPLLDIPDKELDESELRQKRHQRLMKSGLEARLRAKAEKEARSERQAVLEKEDLDRRQNDIEGWLASRREARASLLERIRERDRQSRDMGNRKSMASQMRMKTLANLASDAPAKKRRRGAGDDDDFGANDDDWGVYRTVATGEAASDEEEEEDLDGEMQKLEQELLEHDPDFHESHTMGAAKDWTKSLMHAFLHGPRPFDPENPRDAHQLHLNVERIRIPEVIFQPGIAGLDQAGLTDIASAIIDNLDSSRRSEVLRDVFLTGGNTMFDGFDDRVRKELRAKIPIDLPLQVRRAQDPLLDAWKGASGWARTGAYKKASVTRQQYDEQGSDYMKEHDYGNVLSS